MDQALSDAAARPSLWMDTLGPAALDHRAPLPGDTEADVAIVGGGLTGLWTAYYLLARRPEARVVVLERRHVGFGASGRNGGWCSALFPKSAAALERRHGFAAARALRHAMVDTVDEVGRVVAAEGIDCDYAKGGTVLFARTPAQRRSARADVIEAARFGVDELRMLTDPDRVLDPACARVHPAKLVRGLADVVEARGAVIHESTTVTSWAPGVVSTDRGTVHAGSIIIATEGYGATLKQAHRSVLPLYSLMIATEPLTDEMWDRLGIAHGQTFSDYRHLLIYGQRTADNRVAFGGRGARYHWGSSIRDGYDHSERVFHHLRAALIDLFPQLAGVTVTHAWGGPLGVPRDWHAAVRYDEVTGIGWAGGYVGDGLSTTNLAGRTLAELITGERTALSDLPWVGHRSRNWEPEPLRFLGANLGLVAMAVADAEERVTRRPSLIAKAMGPLVGQ